MNIVKDSKDYRTLSVGKKLKNDLFWSAVNCYRSAKRNINEIHRIKGMQAFVLSIEKNGYEDAYSTNMINLVHECGYSTLKELIDSLQPYAVIKQ